jgi:predicted MPP superfamily phosphohydrolase
MNKILMFVLFIVGFSSIYLGLEFYVLSRLFGLLGIVINIYFYIILIIFFVSFILSSVLEAKMSNFITKIYYITSVTVLGILFLLFFLLIIFEMINLIIKLPEFYSAIFILGVVIVLTIYSLINAQKIKINEVNVNLGLEKEIKAVQISDIHLGSIQGYSFLEKVVNKINNINPEVVFITGDFFDSSAPVAQETINLLDNIKAPIYFTLGNHEEYYDLEKVTLSLSKTKVKLLRNEVVDFKEIQIIGIDHSDKKNYLIEVMKKIKLNKTKKSILLFHPPTKINYLSKMGINLTLSGHTHGGQIFPFNLFVRMAYPYTHGLHNKENSYEYVCQGTGTWGPPMRLGTNNEIAVINIK